MEGSSALEAWVQERLATLDLAWPGLPSRVGSAVVGFDGGSTSQHAARWAARLADEVHLVVATGGDHAYETGPLTRRDARTWSAGLQARVQTAKEELLEVLTEVRLGERSLEAGPVEALQRAVAELSPDMLLVGTKNKGWLDRAALGSVAEAMVHHAMVTTLLANQPPGNGPIVAAVGTDRGSAYAGAWGTALATWLDRELVLAHGVPEERDHPFPQVTDGARAVLVAWPPRKGVVELAEDLDADLVITGHGPAQGWLGSTAIGLTRSAPCSLVVARPWTKGG